MRYLEKLAGIRGTISELLPFVIPDCRPMLGPTKNPTINTQLSAFGLPAHKAPQRVKAPERSAAPPVARQLRRQLQLEDIGFHHGPGLGIATHDLDFVITEMGEIKKLV